MIYLDDGKLYQDTDNMKEIWETMEGVYGERKRFFEYNVCVIIQGFTAFQWMTVI